MPYEFVMRLPRSGEQLPCYDYANNTWMTGKDGRYRYESGCHVWAVVTEHAARRALANALEGAATISHSYRGDWDGVSLSTAKKVARQGMKDGRRAVKKGNNTEPRTQGREGADRCWRLGL